MNLLYIVWGERASNHTQCIFSLLSALQYPDSFDDYYVLTDHPEYYKIIESKINIIAVSKNQIKEWIGPENYIFNVKIKGIEYFNKLYPDKIILFADTDTFFYKDPSPLRALISDKQSVMHMNEGTYDANMKRSQTARRVFPKLAKLDLGNYRITGETCMHNSGVLGIYPSEKFAEILKNVFDVTDTLNAANLRLHYTEQLAFTLVLQKETELYTAHEYVAHYFPNKKEWDENIKSFFAKCFLKNLTIEQLIAEYKNFEFDIPIRRKKKGLNKRLSKFLDKILPERINYLDDTYGTF